MSQVPNSRNARVGEGNLICKTGKGLNNGVSHSAHNRCFFYQLLIALVPKSEQHRTGCLLRFRQMKETLRCWPDSEHSSRDDREADVPTEHRLPQNQIVHCRRGSAKNPVLKSVYTDETSHCHPYLASEKKSYREC